MQGNLARSGPWRSSAAYRDGASGRRGAPASRDEVAIRKERHGDQDRAQASPLGTGPCPGASRVAIDGADRRSRRDPRAIENPYPLRAADTSSPRDTFRTYIRDITTAIEDWRNDRPPARTPKGCCRAPPIRSTSAKFTAVDRSTTITIKMLLLKEILDRVSLPPFSAIPDDEQVAQEGIVRWTVPNTKIEIAKIAEGPDAGEFLFTKETVENLDAYYALARDLPYKSGASVGLYREYISTPGRWISRDFPDTCLAGRRSVVLGQGIWQWISGRPAARRVGMP